MKYGVKGNVTCRENVVLLMINLGNEMVLGLLSKYQIVKGNIIVVEEMPFRVKRARVPMQTATH